MTDKLEPFGFSDDEKADLFAFLESLKGEEIMIRRPERSPYGFLAFPL
ncbi:MAG: hypothetical protein AAFO01_11860 [Pseudomonadota bacterium]